MITESKLIAGFGAVERTSKGLLVCKHILPKYAYTYFFDLGREYVLVAVVQIGIDSEFASRILQTASFIQPSEQLTVYAIPSNKYNFTHALLVPSAYHGYLHGVRGIVEDDRRKLYLCIPIFRSEFSGDETVEEFKDMRFDTVPTLDWKRNSKPKIYIYFDNPKTGSRALENSVRTSADQLFEEIDLLNGVTAGFIEVTNYKRDVLEILSPRLGWYALIKNRTDRYEMGVSDLKALVLNFLEAI